jgi:beta-mannanase
LRFILTSAFVIATALSATGVALSNNSSGYELGVVRKLTDELLYGAYNPAKSPDNFSVTTIEHIFVFWNHIDGALLSGSLDEADKNERTLLITVEPFTKAANWRDGADYLFSEILSGGYDAEIYNICSNVAQSGGEVWLRWGHEMDDGQGGRYPWAGHVNNTKGYVDAYRYFVEKCRRLAPKTKYVWSPTGLRDASQYYPGDGYVDFVGVSLYSLEAWDLDNLGRWSSPKKTLQGRYDRVAGFRKPIVLAEVGVAGSSAYVKEWLRGLVREASSLPLLKAIIYFNARETGVWERYGKPDWRVSSALWQKIANSTSR